MMTAIANFNFTLASCSTFPSLARTPRALLRGRIFDEIGLLFKTDLFGFRSLDHLEFDFSRGRRRTDRRRSRNWWWWRWRQFHFRRANPYDLAFRFRRWSRRGRTV